MSVERIRISGIRELQSALREMDRALPKTLRVGLNKIAELVVNNARPLVAKRSGRAAASLKVKSSQREARVGAGGRRAPHYPWLDFGGRTGPARSVVRPFYKDGRYIYPTVARQRPQINELAADVLTQVATDAGLEVT